MNVLIRTSKVLELESDETPFSHVMDQYENLSVDLKHKAISQNQKMMMAMYEKKKSGEPEVKQPEKIATALKSNQPAYKPEFISKKVEPAGIATQDVNLEIIEEENQSNQHQKNESQNPRVLAINGSFDGATEGYQDIGSERNGTLVK